MLQIVCASKTPRETFFADTALGKSIKRIVASGVASVRIWGSNTRGLSELYNMAIDAADAPEYLLFVHDDVYIEDFFAPLRIIEGLRRYDILGLAGSSFTHGQLRWGVPPVGTSGAVGHGKEPFGQMASFGTTPKQVDVLDGLFIAAKTETLRREKVRFDPSFRFHFYDLDFCMTAKRAGLRLGTWPISVTHQSGGRFDSPAWTEASEVFARKWYANTPSNDAVEQSSN